MSVPSLCLGIPRALSPSCHRHLVSKQITESPRGRTPGLGLPPGCVCVAAGLRRAVTVTPVRDIPVCPRPPLHCPGRIPRELRRASGCGSSWRSAPRPGCADPSPGDGSLGQPSPAPAASRGSACLRQPKILQRGRCSPLCASQAEGSHNGIYK